MGEVPSNLNIISLPISPDSDSNNRPKQVIEIIRNVSL